MSWWNDQSSGAAAFALTPAQISAFMKELVFEVIEEADGGYSAECLTESIVTEGNSWDDLRTNVREAVRGYYFDQPENLLSASASPRS